MLRVKKLKILLLLAHQENHAILDSVMKSKIKKVEKLRMKARKGGPNNRREHPDHLRELSSRMRLSLKHDSYSSMNCANSLFKC